MPSRLQSGLSLHQLLRHRGKGRKRDRIIDGIGGVWVRGVAHDHHLRLRIDVDRLPVDAARLERAVLIAGLPPHVAIGPAEQGLVASVGTFLLVAALYDVGDRFLLDNLLTVEATLVAYHFTEAGEIAQRGVEPTASAFCADAINHEISIVLGTELLPDLLRQEICHRLAR